MKKLQVIKVLAVGVAIVGVGFTTVLNANAAEWTPRTVQQIQADIAKTNGKEYTIVEGDTLSGISYATNITVEGLAARNSIKNIDLIYAGNKLIFEGDVVTVQDNKGETIAQTVITEKEKVDPSKPVGQKVDKTTTNKATDKTTNTAGSTSTTNNSTNSNANTNNDAPATNTDTNTGNNDNTNTNGSTGNTGNSTDTNTDNGSTSTTPSTPVTPSTPSETPSTPEPTTPSETPSTPSTPTEPSTPTTPSTPAEPTIVSGYVGNSGLIFDSGVEANIYGDHILDTDFSKNGYVTITIYYSDGTEKFSIDWY